MLVAWPSLAAALICSNGSASARRCTQPTGEDPTLGRVVRGGSDWADAGNCRSAYRGANEPGLRGWNLGCRLAAGQPPGRAAPGLAAGDAVALVPEAPAARPASNEI